MQSAGGSSGADLASLELVDLGLWAMDLKLVQSLGFNRVFLQALLHS
jgi:hypothetical protein